MHCFLETFDSESFDRERLRGAGESGEDAKSSYHYVLASQPFQGRSEYAVGFLKGQELHLTPVSTIQQFTPVIRAANTSTVRDIEDVPLHLRKKVMAEREAHAVVGPRTVEEAHSSHKAEDAVVGGPIGEIVNRQMRRLRSVALNGDAKNSTRLEFYSHHSVESRGVLRRLLCTTSSNAPAATSQRLPAASAVGPTKAYFPTDSASTTDSGVTLAKHIVTRFAAEHSVAVQIKDLMASAQVLTVAAVRRTVKATNAQSVETPATNQQVVEGLRQCAAFMHGVWIAKANEEFRGNNAALREVVLLHFARSASGALKRSAIIDLFNRRVIAPQLLSTTLKDVLASVACLTQDADPNNRVWRLRGVPVDDAERTLLVSSFQAEFPLDFQFQQQFWQKRGAAIMSHVDVINGGRLIRQLFLVGQPAQSEANAAASTSRGAGLTINTASSATTAAAPSLSSLSATDPLIMSIRQFVRRIFTEHGVINKQRVKEMLLRNKESSFPTATGPAFLFAVNEECQTFTAPTFVLRSIDREVDKFRPDFLKVAAEMQTFESKAFVQRVTEQMALDREAQGLPTGEAPAVNIPASIATRIISEIAEYKQGERLWHVKSGNIA